ncbi:MAG TPA: tetratricopeptide repeat protein [Fimbriimonas sp.]
MRVASLPYNAAEGTKPAYGRQFAAFTAEQLRVHAEADINAVSFLTQIPDQQGVNRVAFVNLEGEFLPYDQIKDLFQQSEADLVLDGLLKENEGNFELTYRFSGPDSEEPIAQDVLVYPRSHVFELLHELVKRVANQMQIGLPEFLSGEQMQFGTEDPEAFLAFLEGYDSLGYIQQANGLVTQEFSPQGAIDSLLDAMQRDPGFEGPYHVLVQLCRACAGYQLGNFEMVQNALAKAVEIQPEPFPAYLAMGELHAAVGDHGKAADWYEKAIQREPNDPTLFTRLGVEQLASNMPVNAERNFRKAIELGGEDKSALDYLAMVLTQTGRAHEVPPLWKSELDKDPQSGEVRGKYAYSLLQAGKEQEAEQVFEEGLTQLEDNTVLKRFYAPYLTQKGDLDRAMDFYEDCLDVAPNDIPLQMEYIQVLEQAGREVDLLEALRNVLASNPDANTQAVVNARLIELEQPKRVESVDNARTKMEGGDFETAVRELKPLRNWLADYWKLWALLSSAYNRLEQWSEAEDAATRLLNMYPACEPAYGELATALNGQGRHDDAYNLMRFAAQNNPGSLPIHVNLALAAKRAGHQEEARGLAKQIREALGPNEELDPILADIER